MKTTWSLYLDRIRRYKWLVLAFGLVSAAAAYAAVVTVPTTYTVYATLSTATANRAPEQDGVLASGYVDYFNSAGYQNKLKATQGLPADVTLHARTAAASPIIYVEVTSESQSTAESVAPMAAAAFSDEINSHLRAAQDATIAEVRKPFDAVRLANGVVSEVSLEQLQDRINQITGDSTNKLTSLQMESAVSVNSPDAWPGAVIALFAGLFAGCLLAVAVGAASRRLPGGAELTAKIGVTPLVELPAETGRLYGHRVQQLVNAVALADLPSRSTVVVTSTVASDAAVKFAFELAEGRAAQGASVVFVNADTSKPNGVGFGDLMADETKDPSTVAVATVDPNLIEITSGRCQDGAFGAITAPRADAVFSRLREQADLVVVYAPPITEAAETQVLCAVADGVLLAIDSKRSRAGDASEAVTTLESSRARLLGSVLINSDSATGSPSLTGRSSRVMSGASGGRFAQVAPVVGSGK